MIDVTGCITSSARHDLTYVNTSYNIPKNMMLYIITYDTHTDVSKYSVMDT